MRSTPSGCRPAFPACKGFRGKRLVIAGRAVTVTLAAGPAPADAPKVHLGARAIEAAGAGKMIVVQHPKADAGGWGGVLSQAAKIRGVEGVVVDGYCRDLDEANDLGFPIFGIAGTPRTARGRVHEIAVNAPIVIGGTPVRPNDIVVADGAGVAIVPAERAEDVLAAANKIAARERLMVADLNAGKPVTQVLGANYEDMLKEVG
jgi:regulator of RNase E activity RraA